MSDVALAKELQQNIEKLKREVAKIIIGQDQVIHEIILAILGSGHALLIGVPGLAKTLMVHTIARSLGLDFKRVQFTPDLMPSDILGTEILDESRHFQFIKGPVFTNILLADEINRTPPKTQSALLEAMQEKQVSIANRNFELDKPFFVLATQNPIEQEGTYPLPEAQLDRFMFALNLDYPSFDEEVEVVKSTTIARDVHINPVIDKSQILAYQELVKKVPVADNVIEYAVRLVGKTRPKSDAAPELVKKYLDWGAGPRASQNLILAAKANALINGKLSPDIEDVQAIAKGILRHRILLNYKGEAEGITVEDIIEELM